jgi:hypothetical protein
MVISGDMCKLSISLYSSRSSSSNRYRHSRGEGTRTGSLEGSCRSVKERNGRKEREKDSEDYLEISLALLITRSSEIMK